MLKLFPRAAADGEHTTSYTPGTVAVAPRVGRLFDAVCHGSEESRPALRDAVDALVERLKRDAQPPERVVRAVKSAIARYGNAGHIPSLVDSLDAAEVSLSDLVYRDVFAWTIKSYYDEA